MTVQKAGDGNYELELWWALWPIGLLFIKVLIEMNVNISNELDFSDVYQSVNNTMSH